MAFDYCPFKHIKKSLLLISVLPFFLALVDCSYPKLISTQGQFDEAVTRINKGEEMHIVLRPGKYILKKSIRAKSPLSIKGNSATITSSGKVFSHIDAVRETQTHYVYKLDEGLSLFPLFFDKDNNLLTISESVVDSVRVNYVEGEMEEPSGYKKGVSLKIPIPLNLKHLKNKDFDRAYGYLDSGWEEIRFQLVRSDDQSFYCTTLVNCTTKYFQYDKKTYKKPIRFVICNAEQKKNAIFFDSEWLYVPKRLDEVYVVNNDDEQHKVPVIVTYSDIDLEGVCFYGGTKVSVHSGKDEKCKIRGCHFRNILGYALNIVKENGDAAQIAIVENCSFQNCSLYSGSVVLLNSNKNNGKTCVEMKGCTVNRYSSEYIYYKNAKGAIWVDGDISLIENVVYNTCRNHLHLYKGMIVAKGNFLYNTDAFNSKTERNCSSDLGLVYCDHIYKETQDAIDNTCNKIILEGNLLYGAYAYGGDARGVFIDDGRGDVVCKDNIILNTQLFSIDARNSKKAEASSVRNRYEGNIVTTKYRLAAGNAVTDGNTPTMNSNIVLTSKRNLVSNVHVEKEDSRMKLDVTCSCNGNTIKVSESLLGVLKNSSAWKYVGKHISRR